MSQTSVLLINQNEPEPAVSPPPQTATKHSNPEVSSKQNRPTLINSQTSSLQTILRSLSPRNRDKKAISNIEQYVIDRRCPTNIKRTQIRSCQDARDEVDLQGGAPLREEEGGGGENQVQIFKHRNFKLGPF